MPGPQLVPPPCQATAPSTTSELVRHRRLANTSSPQPVLRPIHRRNRRHGRRRRAAVHHARREDCRSQPAEELPDAARHRRPAGPASTSTPRRLGDTRPTTSTPATDGERRPPEKPYRPSSPVRPRGCASVAAANNDCHRRPCPAVAPPTQPQAGPSAAHAALDTAGLPGSPAATPVDAAFVGAEELERLGNILHLYHVGAVPESESHVLRHEPRIRRRAAGTETAASTGSGEAAPTTSHAQGARGEGERGSDRAGQERYRLEGVRPYRSTGSGASLAPVSPAQTPNPTRAVTGTRTRRRGHAVVARKTTSSPADELHPPRPLRFRETDP